MREKFSSRMGFILISAGCAIGLGNVWRFPYIVGKYGGAAFVLIYLVFLVLLGLPILVMEYSVGRASQKSVATSFDVLEPKGTKWHLTKYVAIVGNYMLMMFYTTIAGWMLIYFVKTLTGEFNGMNTQQVSAVFPKMLENSALLIFFMGVVVLIGWIVCSRGLKNGVEKVSKIMMISLMALMFVLLIRSLTLEGAMEGVKFFLFPDFAKMMEYNIGEVIYAAMGQAFFTLSVGIGAIAIFGSYIGKERRLTGEAINVLILDTLVAIVAGLIIIPACFAYGVNPGEGPGLVFITLPNIFVNMPLGQLWGSLFFLFMSFAALTTIIAVFENIISFHMDLKGCSRKKATRFNITLLFILSIPCALGYNILKDIQPLGIGSNIQDLEDFIVSNNLLPIGSLFYLLFCTSRYGWGWKNFLEEANTGKGLRFPKILRFYLFYILPLIIIFILVQGYIAKFF